MGNTPSKDDSSGTSSAVTSTGNDDPDPSPSARRDYRYINNNNKGTHSMMIHGVQSTTYNGETISHDKFKNNSSSPLLTPIHGSGKREILLRDNSGKYLNTNIKLSNNNDCNGRQSGDHDENLDVLLSLAQTLKRTQSATDSSSESLSSSTNSTSSTSSSPSVCSTESSSSPISQVSTTPVISGKKEPLDVPVPSHTNHSTIKKLSSSSSPSSSWKKVVSGPLQVALKGRHQHHHQHHQLKYSKNVDSIIQTLVETGLSKRVPKNFPIDYDTLKFVCAKAREIFMNQPMLLELAAPVKVGGDLHGQFHDLLRIFKLCGFPPNSNYLFMGDYVDRGKQSLETIILLLCLKIKFPENFFLLRGNHESAGITRIYGFYDECKRRASVKTWKMIVDVFNTFPVAATIGGRIFCVHGGISPELTDFKQIKKIRRPTDIPAEGLLTDLLWSDPQVSGQTEEYLLSGGQYGSPCHDVSKKGGHTEPEWPHRRHSLNRHHYGTDWIPNDRGVSYCFSKKAVTRFCERFGLDLIVRGHMVVEDGYEFFGKRHLVTVFSAPNYCGEFDNWGAVMNVNRKLTCSFELLKPRRLKKK